MPPRKEVTEHGQGPAPEPVKAAADRPTRPVSVIPNWYVVRIPNSEPKEEPSPKRLVALVAIVPFVFLGLLVLVLFLLGARPN